ncbi:hypothetical protein L914_21613 [Phytophthora nicotianae]|uniref:Uncharacterized protein n=1 Tax=Phytophthora nicotianae TaxID=4792 RepID=W2M2U4_PHYNI|nr:hypothetical protein L914_21613 [Phytophthora nicotianae]
MATLQMHYPDMLKLQCSSLYIQKFRYLLVGLAVAEAEILAWSSTISRGYLMSRLPHALEHLAKWLT